MHSINLFVMSQSALQSLLDDGEPIIYTLPVADMVLVSPDSIVNMYVSKSTGPRIRHNHVDTMELLDMLHKTTNAPIAWVQTDYFGGIGEQSAILINDGKIVEYPEDINGALRDMGVKCSAGMDEFDTIGLGRYRTNDDAFDPEPEEPTVPTREERLASVFEKIKATTVPCPECESVDETDYLCLTCGETGGDGVIYVLTWIRQNKDICKL